MSKPKSTKACITCGHHFECDPSDFNRRFACSRDCVRLRPSDAKALIDWAGKQERPFLLDDALAAVGIEANRSNILKATADLRGAGFERAPRRLNGARFNVWKRKGANPEIDAALKWAKEQTEPFPLERLLAFVEIGFPWAKDMRVLVTKALRSNGFTPKQTILDGEQVNLWAKNHSTFDIDLLAHWVGKQPGRFRTREALDALGIPHNNRNVKLVADAIKGLGYVSRGASGGPVWMKPDESMDKYVQKIAAWGMAQKRPFTARQALNGVGVPDGEIDDSLIKKAAYALSASGFKRGRMRVDGEKTRVWSHDSMIAEAAKTARQVDTKSLEARLLKSIEAKLEAIIERKVEEVLQRAMAFSDAEMKRLRAFDEEAPF